MVKKLTGREASEAIARGLAAGPRGFEPVPVSQDDYDAWMAVETAYARVEETGAGAMEALADRLGGDAEAMDAMRAWRRVQALVKLARARSSRDAAFPVPEVAPPKLSAQEISEYAAERATALGWPLTAVLGKAQGSRAAASGDSLKRARDQIIVDLRDRGATFADIGAVFGGRSKEAIYQIDKAARERRLRDIQEQYDARGRNDA